MKTLASPLDFAAQSGAAVGQTHPKLPYIMFAVLIAAELAAILALNRGVFIYTLDDAYIHLALAQRILAGTYGINAHEFAAPASSILWPFLLAPFAGLPVPIYSLVPLALNTLIASATLALLVRELRRVLAVHPAAQFGQVAAAFAVGLVVATNLVPLIFTGMEHSLQQLLAAAIVAGLVEESRTRRGPMTLWLGLLLIPLVRYDSLALVVPSLVYLLWRGHLRGTVTVGLAVGGALTSFSLVLMQHGLGFLPASVMAKSQVLQAGGAPAVLLLNLYTNLLTNTQGNMLLFGLALTLAAASDRRRPAAERGVAVVVMTAIILEVLLGKFGAYFRYEVYLWTATLIAVLHLYRDAVAGALRSPADRGAQVALFGTLGAASLGYMYALASTPLAANNIFDQQYQMHRFVTQYYRGPVAVNDLGWAAFDNPAYVLDLAGLASHEALLARLDDPGSDWISRLCTAHGARLAMIYDSWFRVRPVGWVHLGTLKLSRFRITPAEKEVQFYATDPAAAGALRSLLVAFQHSLPRGSSFELRAASTGSGPDCLHSQCDISASAD